MADTPSSDPPTPAEPTSPAVEDVEAEEAVCHICANPFTYVSLSPCLHTTCHICALRLRALYKSADCTVCKQPQPRLLFLFPDTVPDSLAATTPDDREDIFDDVLGKCPFSDEALSVHFETLPMKEAALQLLRFNCPFSDMHFLTDPDAPLPPGAPPNGCHFVARRGGFPELTQHVERAHHRKLCELCIRSKKIFAHEHVLYTPKQLAMHLPSLPRPATDVTVRRQRRRGPQQELESESEEEKEEQPAVVDWSHPMCAFCRECFATDDDLFAHLREAHEECFLCRRAGLRDVYFQNYAFLARHFTSAHHPCPHPACTQQHFVVFSSILDLKAHYVQTHGSELSRRELAEMGRIEGVFEGAGGGGNNGRAGAGQGQGQGGRRGRFGAQLTPDAEGEAPAGTPATPASREALDTLQRQTLTDEQANALRALLRPLPPLQPTQHLSLRSSLLSWLSHQSAGHDLIAILSSLLSSASASSASSSFSSSSSAGSEHVSRAISSLCNHGGLSEEREIELRTDLNAWKAEQAQAFPSLGAASDFAAIASGRGIPAPAPAPQPRPQPQTGRRGRATPRTVWDRVERAAAAALPPPPQPQPQPQPGPARPPAQRAALARLALPESSFPALSGSGARPAPRGNGQPSTAWSAAAAAAASSSRPSPAPSPRPAPAPAPQSQQSQSHSRTRPRPPPPPNPAAFPTLPTREIAKVPLGAAGGNRSLRNIVGGSEVRGSSWGPRAPPAPVPVPAPARSPETEGAEGEGEGERGDEGGGAGAGVGVGNGAAGGGGKKKKRVKETLFTLGSFPTS